VDELLQKADDDFDVPATAFLRKQEVTEELEPGYRYDWDDPYQYTRDFSYNRGRVAAAIKSQVKRVDAANSDDLGNNLLVSAEVYTMADKFLLPSLKLLALDRFYLVNDALTLKPCPDKFLSVYSEIYELAPTDLILQELCAEYVHNTSKNISDSKCIADISEALTLGARLYTLLDLKDLHDDEYKPRHWIQRMRESGVWTPQVEKLVRKVVKDAKIKGKVNGVLVQRLLLTNINGQVTHNR